MSNHSVEASGEDTYDANDMNQENHLYADPGRVTAVSNVEREPKYVRKAEIQRSYENPFRKQNQESLQRM